MPDFEGLVGRGPLVVPVFITIYQHGSAADPPKFVVHPQGLDSRFAEREWSGAHGELRNRLFLQQAMDARDRMLQGMDGSTDLMAVEFAEGRGGSVEICMGCGRFSKGTMRRCARCKETPYCSAACQRLAWPQHKQTCVQASKTAKDGGTGARLLALAIFDCRRTTGDRWRSLVRLRSDCRLRTTNTETLNLYGMAYDTARQRLYLIEVGRIRMVQWS
ncbi:hypothetical protein DFJ74DRAFT_713028 [Hyaloraphidium curvatum]|nr:hypothetical protein DFJ74DRAFT_713028 [Hyaloraphidium curvatum]